MSEDRFVYCVGIRLGCKEDYDRLMNDYSEGGLFGLDFKSSFEGYPPDYPSLLQYTTTMSPFGFGGRQLDKLVQAGYTIQISKDDES